MSETSTPLHAYGVDDDVGAQSQSCSSRGSLQSNATGSLLASSEGLTAFLNFYPTPKSAKRPLFRKDFAMPWLSASFSGSETTVPGTRRNRQGFGRTTRILPPDSHILR